MEVGVYASDWDRLPIGMYGLGKDDECCNVRSVSSTTKEEGRQRPLLSVRPFATAMSCERSVRAINAWFDSVKLYD